MILTRIKDTTVLIVDNANTMKDNDTMILESLEWETLYNVLSFLNKNVHVTTTYFEAILFLLNYLLLHFQLRVMEVKMCRINFLSCINAL